MRGFRREDTQWRHDKFDEVAQEAPPRTRSFTEQARNDAPVPPLNVEEKVSTNERLESAEEEEASETLGDQSPTNTLLDEAV